MTKNIILTGLSLLSSACSIFGARTVEEPKYQSLYRQGSFELRRYETRWAARTLVEENLEESSNEGFRRLAGYIFGANRSKKSLSMTAPVVQEKEGQKIAMTAPVVQEPASQRVAMTAPVIQEPQAAKAWYMYFILPSELGEQDIPEPLDSKVEILRLPSETLAIHSYSGFFSEEKFKTKSQELLDWLASQSLKAIGPPRSARYNPPWSFWFLRHHEVQIPIETSTSANGTKWESTP